MDSVGLYDKIRVTGYNYEELYLSNPQGHQLGLFLNGSQHRYNYPAVRIHRRDVRNLLIEHLGEEGIPIHYNKRFKEIVEETASSVTVAFTDGTQATGDYVIGCDGIHSKIRHHIHPDAHPIFQDLVGMMGTVYPDQLTDKLGPEGEQESKRWPVALPRMTFGDKGMFGTFPSDFAGVEFGFFTVQHTHARTREEWAEFERNKAELKESMEACFLKEKGGSDYPPEVRILVERSKPETLSSWPFYVVPETSAWYSDKGRIIFMGDAAHAM